MPVLTAIISLGKDGLVTAKRIGFPKTLLEWIPVLGFAIILTGVYAVLFWDDTVDEFSPLEINETLLIEPSYIVTGYSARLTNGFCNHSKEDVIVDMYVALQSPQADPLEAQTYVLINDKRTLQPGCYYDKPVTVRVPLDVPPGRWKLFVEMIARGSKPGDMQRVNKVSNEFTIIAVSGQ